MPMLVAMTRAKWSGLSGGEGVSLLTWYRQDLTAPTDSDAQNASDNSRALFLSFAGQMPNDVTITIDPNFDVYDVETAALVSSVTAATPAAGVTGTVSTGYHAAAGGKVDWNTGVVAYGRRIVGHTYVVPMGAVCYEADGTIGAANITAIQNGCNTYLSAMRTDALIPCVWSRPGNVKTLPGITEITTATMKNKSAVLRGRRD